MPPRKSQETPTFEQSIARLEEIVQQTDAPVTDLETMLSLVEESTRIIRRCKAMLRDAELRIKTLENPELNTTEVNKPSPHHDESEPFTLS